ncbi:hypothetical protein Mal64_30120 [Pseudobythopirellula maris]|uniref:Uncharacterized protein n=1 Tax=Pseudobythopirellula maris TaxID=2527991 RepID=A0A5C5ZM11_9BACT|nr:hypothetical protein [Pseudobythopirellula maris]TWT87473.1 hypothetical protein Mal64_30120 [Pseudobythopirellula maris]
MRRPLEDFGAQRYDRPNEPWVCGLSEEGRPCPVGPTRGGVCPALAECVPVRQGDRWVCNRSTHRGGPCDGAGGGGGPSPEGACCRVATCKPKRSLRTVRGRWSLGAAAFALGAVLMLLGTAQRNELVAPGPLTSHHAQIVGRENWADRCAACHPAGASGALGVVGRAALGHGVIEPGGPTQSALCLKCHQGLDAAGAAMLAHGLPAQSLPSSKPPVESDSVVNASLSSAPFAGMTPSGAHGGEVACAVCHQEHHGADHNLARLTDARCQACHQERFESFASDHPDFGVWPHGRRQRIAFNHASHQTKHHPSKSETFDCRVCHTADATGDLTALAPFETSCASCHEASIDATSATGVALLALPMVDDAALADAGRPLGLWPESAKGDFDGDMPALQKLLLASDPEARRALQLLGADFTFFDVDPGNEEQVAAAADLVDATRALVADLAEHGGEAVAQRVAALVSLPLGGTAGLRASRVPASSPLPNPPQQGEGILGEGSLAPGLPREMAALAWRLWNDDADAPHDPPAAPGVWSIDRRGLALKYRPTGHADPMLRAWLDTIAALPDEHAALRDAALAELAGPTSPGGCATCHSLEQRPGGRLALNWLGRDRTTEPRGFTHFSHRPHVVQPELEDCTACHQVDAAAASATDYASLHPAQFVTQFAPLGKQACVSCHQPHLAGDSCTQCHHYHVEGLGVRSEGLRTIINERSSSPAFPSP